MAQFPCIGLYKPCKPHLMGMVCYVLCPRMTTGYLGESNHITSVTKCWTEGDFGVYSLLSCTYDELKLQGNAHREIITYTIWIYGLMIYPKSKVTSKVPHMDKFWKKMASTWDFHIFLDKCAHHRPVLVPAKVKSWFSHDSVSHRRGRLHSSLGTLPLKQWARLALTTQRKTFPT